MSCHGGGLGGGRNDLSCRTDTGLVVEKSTCVHTAEAGLVTNAAIIKEADWLTHEAVVGEANGEASIVEAK